MRHHVLAALGAALLVAVPLAARAQGVAGPDFKEKCQKAAAEKLSLKKKDIKVLGKHKNSDGYMVVDFNATDGRKGACYHEGNGKVYDVKVEGTAATPATKPAHTSHHGRPSSQTAPGTATPPATTTPPATK